MPIDRDRFESEELPVQPGTNKHRVLAFLADTPEEAFTRSEIAEGAGVDPDSVGPVLVRLREDGLVEHSGTHWAVARDERLADLG